MTTPLNERDLIQLNAYLDGELSAGEQAAFEQRLAADRELRAELRAIRATKMLLGMAERQRAPRNFTLDPAVYGGPAKASLLERLGLARIPNWAMAGAALVLTIVCAGVLILNGVSGRPAFNVAMEAPAQDAAEPEIMAQEAAEAPGEEAVEEAAPMEEPAAAEAFRAEEAEGDDAAADGALADEALTEAEETARAEAPVGMGGGMEEGIPPAPTVIGPPEDTPSAALAAPAAAEPEVAEEADAGVEVEGEAAAAGEAAADTQQPSAAQTAEAARQAARVRQPRTVLVVGLAAAVVAALVAGIWVALRSRRH